MAISWKRLDGQRNGHNMEETRNQAAEIGKYGLGNFCKDLIFIDGQAAEIGEYGFGKLWKDTRPDVETMIEWRRSAAPELLKRPS
eukprot:scaffold1138_cov128-Cylindrotheca_fusiformis.AAC.23